MKQLSRAHLKIMQNRRAENEGEYNENKNINNQQAEVPVEAPVEAPVEVPAEESVEAPIEPIVEENVESVDDSNDAKHAPKKGRGRPARKVETEGKSADLSQYLQ